MKLTHYHLDPTNPDSVSMKGIYTLLFDRRGELWLGWSNSGGVSRFDPVHETIISYRHDPEDQTSLSNDNVSVVHEDRSGVLWVATMGGGLNRFDPVRDAFTRYGEKDGLPNTQVTAILEDERGRLWLSSYGGVTRFDPHTGSMKTYGAEDGLQGDIFGFQSAWRSSSGEMFFGGPSGLSAFFPDQLESDSYAPPVAITDFQILNRSIPLSERSPEPSSQPHLVLDHRDNVFAFEFSALHFRNPGRNRFAYYLEPFESDWVQVGPDKRFAQYTNLDGGEYVFRVKASNADGVWNEEGTSVRLTVRPPP